MVGKLFLSATLLILLGGAFSKEGPQVQIEQGTLHGTYLTSSNGRKFAAFQGVPYAEPPVGKLRFKEPVPPKPWKGVWNASLPGSMCSQYTRVMPFGEDADPVIGEEDCLFINVYSPQVPTQSLKPKFDVIFFIHGGAFTYGWGHQYGPKFLLDKDIIMVTFNYRLGPLGFLTTEDEVVPGNMGLKDQTAALQWVRKNIAAFGGDPESITLIGNSAGAASVHYHYISPSSRGLFKRGYSQSGSFFCPWTQMEEGLSKAKMLGAPLGCSTKNTKKLIDCLRTRPARQIVQQIENFQVWRYNPFSPFGPTVEVAGSTPFLAKQPIDAILQGDVQDLPWMTSLTAHEGLYPTADWAVNENVIKVLEQRFDELIPHILDYNYTVPKNKKPEVIARLRQHYLQDKLISTETNKDITQMTTDRMFALEVARAAKLQAAVNSAPVYIYQFDYRGKHSLSDLLSGTKLNFGVCHADDLAYTTDCLIANPEDTQDDKNMSYLLVDIWTSYAHNGNPVPPDRSFNWEPTTPNSKELSYLYIGAYNKFEMRSSDDLGNQKFWDSLPINEPQIGKNTPIETKHTEL